MTLPYARVTFERALAGIAGAGYRYVAFGLTHAGEAVPDENDAKAAAKLGQLFEQYGLKPIMLIGNQQLAPGQPLSRARARLELAAALGIPEVLSVGVGNYSRFPDQLLPEHKFAQMSAEFAAHFRNVAEMAQSFGVTITLKPHTGNTATARHLQQSLAAIGSPWVKACYDPGNVRYYEGLAPEDDLPLIAPATYSFIAKDHNGPRAHADFPVPGEGAIDWKRLFTTLKNAGFSGPVVVERVDGTDRGPLEPEEIDRRIARARLNLERLMNEAGLAPSA